MPGYVYIRVVFFVVVAFEVYAAVMFPVLCESHGGFSFFWRLI